MRRFITFISIFATSIAFASQGVVVDSKGILLRPQKDIFAQQNNLVSNEIICLRVDMFRSGGDDLLNRKSFYWTDAELKVLDKQGHLLYFATTSYNDVVNYHSEDGTWDSNCKIFYYISGTKYAQFGQCSNPKQEHIVSAEQKKSIASKEGITFSIGRNINHPITSVEFYPNVSGYINGKSIREIFLNPENTIIISRKDQTELERTGTGERVWRPTIPQYYRK